MPNRSSVGPDRGKRAQVRYSEIARIIGDPRPSVKYAFGFAPVTGFGFGNGILHVAIFHCATLAPEVDTRFSLEKPESTEFLFELILCASVVSSPLRLSFVPFRELELPSFTNLPFLLA